MDNCCRLVGYPPGFQSKRKDNNSDGPGNSRSNGGVQNDRPPRPASRGDSSGTRPQANTSHTAEPSSSKGYFFSDQQYDQMLDMLGKKDTPEYSSNLAGTLQWQGHGDW